MQVIRQLNNSNTISATNQSIQNFSQDLKKKVSLVNEEKSSDLNTGKNVNNKLHDQDISNVDPSNEIDQINKHEVYEQFKKHNINRDQLINLLRDIDPMSGNTKDWLDSNGLYNEEEKKKVADEIRSAYTISTIQNCQDITFLQLLLKNYSRGS